MPSMTASRLKRAYATLARLIGARTYAEVVVEVPTSGARVVRDADAKDARVASTLDEALATRDWALVERALRDLLTLGSRPNWSHRDRLDDHAGGFIEDADTNNRRDREHPPIEVDARFLFPWTFPNATDLDREDDELRDATLALLAELRSRWE